jgi:hypothetical protein
MVGDGFCPWRVYLHGDGYELHIRDGVWNQRLCTEVRVWADGRARVIACGVTDGIAWANLAMALARQIRAGLLGETDDPAESGTCDPVPT